MVCIKGNPRASARSSGNPWKTLVTLAEAGI
jgi:hypothetical protein